MNFLRWRSLGLVILPLLLGCPPNFVEPWQVVEPRPMGARIETAGDPTRPRPRLGEAFSVRQYLALPGPLSSPLAGRYGVGLSLCLGFRTPTGELGCFGEQDLMPTVSVLSEHEILLSDLRFDPTLLGISPEQLAGFDLASVPELAQLDRLALFGVLCVDGRAERIPNRSVRTEPTSQLFRCVGNEGAPFPAPNSFTLSVLLDRGLPYDSNANPSFACDPSAPDSSCVRGVAQPGEPLVPGPIVLALPPPLGAAGPRTVVPWPERAPEAVASWQGCAGDPSLIQVRTASGEHEVRFRFDPSDRQPYRAETERNGVKVLQDKREELLVAHALSERGGKLERYFSELDEADPDTEAELVLAYDPPAQGSRPEDIVPANGRLVRFYFTLRDQRGGVDFTIRELCLVAGE